MVLLLQILGASALFAAAAHCLTPAQWRSQSIYQVMTDRFARTDGSTTAACNINLYCGGTWEGLINHLGYIQGMGFTAIWISPTIENIPQNTSDGAAYHGYWPNDIYAVNTNFGPATDLVSLAQALHEKGMYLMVDVVPNHMASASAATAVNYAQFVPFNSQSYFHPYCPIDNGNQTSKEQCWEGDNIVALADLRTESSNVVSIFQSWVTQLVHNYTSKHHDVKLAVCADYLLFDGLRIDSAANMDQSFLASLESASGVYNIGEIFDGDPNYVCPYQNYISGMLNYPAYFWITQAFQSTTGSIANLYNGINQMKTICKDTTLLGSFSENHDNPRFPSYNSDMSLDMNVIGSSMLADGIPIIYQGQEQHFSGGATPNQREALWISEYSTTSTLYTYITQLNKIRKQATSKDSGYLTQKANPVYYDSSTIAIRKGTNGTQVIGVFNNRGASGCGSFTLTAAASGFTASQSVTELLTCKTYTTDSSGSLAVVVSGGLPLVFYPTTALSGSNFSCPASIASTPCSATPAPTSCASPVASVAVTFQDLVTTQYGQTIKLAGSVPQLGSWNVTSAVVMSSSSYTSSNPVWSVTVDLPAGAAIQYKYINVASDGTVTWEADPNHSYSVPSGCQESATVSNTWQSS